MNEVRAVVELELADLLAPHYGEADAADRAARLREALGGVFEAAGHLSLDRLLALSKREQRPALHELAKRVPAVSPYVEAHVALVSFGIGVVPIDEPTRRYLVEEGAADPEAAAEEVQRFVEQNVKLDEAWPLYQAWRAAAVPADAAGSAEKKPRPEAQARRPPAQEGRLGHES